MVVNSSIRARIGDGKKFNIPAKLSATAVVRELLLRWKLIKIFLQLSIIDDLLEVIPENDQNQSADLI